MGVSAWMKCLIWCLKIICSSVLAWITLLVWVRTHKKSINPSIHFKPAQDCQLNRLEMFCNKFGKEFGSNELFLSMWNLKETRTEKCVAQFVRWEVCHWSLLWKRISLWYYCLVFRKKGWRAFGFTFNHNHYNFFKCDCCISCFTFHWSLCKIVIGQLAIIGNL